MREEASVEIDFNHLRHTFRKPLMELIGNENSKNLHFMSAGLIHLDFGLLFYVRSEN